MLPKLPALYESLALLILYRVLAQTATAPPTLDGFAFVPIRAVFLDSIRLDIEPGSEASAADASPPFLVAVQKGTPPSPTRKA